MLATSALDAESETLVNSALASLIKGNNTTISIAHRLSTVKRSDTIIVLSNNGSVAEMGTYKALSSNPDGAFSKLMEWQMHGGEPIEKSSAANPRGPPTDLDEALHKIDEVGEVEDTDEEGLEVRKEKETKAEAVPEKVDQQRG
jgi:putative ABC transport system ATP-binding protein